MAQGQTMRRIPPKKRTAKPALSECSDGELLSRFVAAHEQAAFTALLERYEPMVLRVCRYVLHHRQDAENACQTTFVVLLGKAELISDRQKIGNWLYGTAHRVALNFRKKKRRRKKHENLCGCQLVQLVHLVQLAQFDDNDGDDTEMREMRDLIAVEVQSLPEKYRVLTVSHYWEGKSKAEIAAESGLPEGTVSCRLERARKQLRCQLARYGIIALS